MGFFGTVTGKVVLGLVVLVVVIAGWGGFLFATDYGLEADVIDTSCGATKTVTIKTKVGGIEHVQDIDSTACQVVKPGNFVIYHLQSGRTLLYEQEGGCLIYDSQTGVSNDCLDSPTGGSPTGGIFGWPTSHQKHV